LKNNDNLTTSKLSTTNKKENVYLI